MKEIIPPIDKNLIEKELTNDKFLRTTNFGNNQLYVITYHDSPYVMQELGRLRELTFREANGGTGKEVDIDELDTRKHPYKQLILWNPEEKEILGGYRFYICGDVQKPEDLDLATSKLFTFSEKFIREYLPYVIELGRSFIQPKYQSTTSSRKELFALDNLWDGLGAIMMTNPDKKYFFGKVTIYQSYPIEARDLLLYFLETYFGDPDQLMRPIDPVHIQSSSEKLGQVIKGDNYSADYQQLSQAIRKKGARIPPLINAYMNLSPTMKTFGTAINRHFGDVMETGIMITIDDLYPSKVKRHVKSYTDG